MPWPVHPTGFFGARGDQDTYRIERSLRFNSADSAYLNRTPASAGNRKTWTWSGWVKISKFSSDINLFDGGATGPLCSIWIDSATNKIRWYFTNSAVSASESAYTSALIRDPSAWYHFVFALDTTQATLSERAKIYINGVQQTLTGLTGTYLTQNSDQGINRNVAHYIGAYSYTGLQSYFDGYLTEINFIDGQALTPSSFGETDAITGRWKAKAYSGTYGTNGFYLKFADNSGTTATTLGKDSSGNGNNWTPNNFSVTAGVGNDSLVDSPTNYGTDTGVGGEVRGNYATLNPLQKDSNITITNGNLDATSSGNYGIVGATVGVSSGKWYWEITATGATLAAGIFNQGVDISSYLGSNANGWAFETWSTFAQKRNNNSASSYGSTLSVNDIVGVKFNADNGTLEFLKNNVSLGTAYSGLTSGPYFPAIADPTTTANINCSVNFGQRPFAYTAPSGFKALCTTNLPQPTIQKPSKYMDVVAYTGTGASNSISSLGFSPDLVWIKNRGTTTDHALYDTTRGTQAQLSSNTTGSEVTSSTGLTAFGTNGFTIGTSSLVNTSGTQYVAWAWDAGETSSTNTAGSITSTVRVNAQAGVSIVSWTDDTSTNNRVGHGLGVAPAVVLYKQRNSAGDWFWTTTKIDGSFDRLSFNTGAKADISSPYTAPTSTTFSNFGSWGGATMIAYCFAEVEGFSRFGSYTGNGSSDGPFVWCGFRPRWVMVKRTDGGTTNWQIWDTARNTSNLTDLLLLPSSANAESTYSNIYGIDTLSNGFKCRGAGSGLNGSGETLIFAAFAESPFKYARAR